MIPTHSVIITGINGFLGTHLSRLIPDAYGVSSRTYDLRTVGGIDALFRHTRPDLVFHLAADVGGLQYNLDNPATIFHNNVIMNTLLIHKAALVGCKKFIFVSSVCAYPAFPPMPTREHHLWDGYPEKSNGSYGLSKRIALVQLEACKKQFGMDFEYPVLANLYGPGDRSSHVIPDLIKKFLAKQDSVQVWGDGSQTRDFLYVADAANALVWLAGLDFGEPVNIVNNYSISINQLVDNLIELTAYQGKIIWQLDRPIGQVARSYSPGLAKQLGWQAQTDFKTGLRRTIEWFKLSS